MPASDLPQAGSRFSYLIKPWRAITEHAGVILSARWIWLFAGLASIIYSQYLMEQRDTIGEHSLSAEILNAVYRLEIVNYDNVYHALPYFLFGALLLFWIGAPSNWKTGFNNWALKWPERDATSLRSNLWNILAGATIMAFLLIQLGRHRYISLYIILWLIALLLFTQIFWKWDKAANINLSPGLTATDIFWMLILFTFGIALGSFALQDHPIILIPDEGAFWETGRAIANGDYQPSIFDSGVYTFPVASSIFQGWAMRIFGINLWGWRFSSVLPAVAAVIPLYLLAREWFDRRVAIAAGFVMLASPYFLSFARFGYNNSQALFPATLCIFLFALSARKGSLFYLWLAGLSSGLAFYTFFAAWIGLVALCIGVVYLFILRRIKWKNAALILALLMAGWFLAFSPRVAYTASGKNSEGLVYKIFETSFINTFYGRAYYTEQELAQTTPLIKIGQHQTIFFDPLIYGELLTRGAVRTFLAMFDPFIVGEHFVTSGLAGVVTPIFFMVGLAISLRNWKQLRFGLSLIWVFGGMVFLSILGAFPPRHTHMVAIIPVIALISSIGLIGLTDTINEYFPIDRKVLRSFATNGIVILILCATFYYGFTRYFITMPKTYPPSFEDVASWVAWRAETPVEIIYIGDVKTPHRIAYLVHAHMLPHTYRSINAKNFSPNTDLDPNIPTIVFYEAGPEYDPAILLQPPKEYDNLASYYDKDNTVIGFALTNTDVNLHPRSGLNDGLHSLIDTPVRYLLAGLLAAIFVVTITIKLQSSP